MDYFEKALWEFCSCFATTEPDVIAKVRASIMKENSPGWKTIPEKAIALCSETQFWKGFKVGFLPTHEKEKVLGYKLVNP